MKKKSADFKSSLHNMCYKGVTITVGEYVLEILVKTATVYWVNCPGRRKLDSLFHKKTGILSVSLPDGKEVEIMNTPEGLKVK